MREATVLREKIGRDAPAVGCFGDAAPLSVNWDNPRVGSKETAAAALHEAVRDFFGCDEGSLPEVQIVDIEPHEAGAIFDSLLALANPLRPGQTVWDLDRDMDAPITACKDQGRLAAEGTLSALHVVLSGVRWKRGPLPDLGVSVWPGTITFDYRAGPDWPADVVARFVDMLFTLRDATGRGGLVLANEPSTPLSEEDQVRFRRAVDRFRDALA